MQRLLIVLLSAFDAVIATAVGVAAALAPLALLWLFGTGDPHWAALWPAAAAVWQLGHAVPLHVNLPADYLAQAGVPTDAASFVVSLAPLAFAAFTAIFAVRSGARAAHAGAWPTGVISSGVVFAALATVVCVTSRTGIAAVHAWQAVLFPTVLFVVAALAGAVVTAWREGDGGMVDRLRDRVDELPGGWPAVPALALRGAGIVLAGLAGLGALAVVVALVARGGEVIALYEAGNVNLIGAIVVSLAQLVYLPTLVVWGLSFVAGPGFAVGTGTAVSPSGTQLGVVPGIPVLGALPPSTSPWLLAIVVLPIAVAAFAGWAVRPAGDVAASRDVPPGSPADPVAPRAAVAVLIAVLSAAGAALLALLAAGSLGPGRLASVGPAPGAVALAVGVETLLGAGILLLSPRAQTAAAPLPRHPGRASRDRFAARPVLVDDLFDRRDGDPSFAGSAADPPAPGDENVTEPIDARWLAPSDGAGEGASDAAEHDADANADAGGVDAGGAGTADGDEGRPPPAASRPDLGPNRPSPLPPID